MFLGSESPHSLSFFKYPVIEPVLRPHRRPSTGKELCAMKMEADLAELRKQNEELRELVNSMLHSVSRHDFRLEESKL